MIREIMPLLLERLNLNDIAIIYQGYDNYDRMIEALNGNEIDAAFPVGGGLYYSEENGIYQSNAVVTSSDELVYKGELNDETVSHFAVNENNRMQDYFIRTNFPDAEITYYPSIEDCLAAIDSGKAGCTTLNGLRANNILKNSKYRRLSLIQLSQNDDRSFGVKIGNEGLLRLLNRGISIIGSDYIQNLAYRYAEQLYTVTIPDFTGKRVLLAEDNELNQQIAQAILTETGITVDIADDGTAAVEMVEKAPAGTYDVILMDIQMPIMDGYTAAKQIRGLADEKKAQIPIIAVTANAFKEDQQTAIDAGMNGHLAKPYDVPKIMETLSEIFNGKGNRETADQRI